ncbi:putative Aspartate aminotransferase protein, partial [Naja naja]
MRGTSRRALKGPGGRRDFRPRESKPRPFRLRETAGLQDPFARSAAMALLCSGARSLLPPRVAALAVRA